MQSNKKVKLLIVGQTPPPYVGQMMMIESLVHANYRNVDVYHTRMNYSQRADQIGKVRLRKVLHLFQVIIDGSYKIFRHRIDVIYYPPGSDRVPLLRDIATLIVLRRFGRKLILVFHASGLCEQVSAWRGIGAWLFRRAFFFPDAAIQKSSLNPPDGEFLKAAAVYTIPNGLADEFQKFQGLKTINSVPVILFVGLMIEEKGVEVLIEAARLLRARGLRFRVEMMGEFVSESYRQEILRRLDDHQLSDWIVFLGRKVANEKWAHFRRADIFCFPSHYRAESFGNVLVEAMMFELPIVATSWRGIPDIVRDGVNGFLAPVRDAAAIAQRLAQLLQDVQLRTSMGQNGRARYLESFTMENYVHQTETVVLEVARKRWAR
ncbi:MAG TPA: glycosyltransferase family 4 protein [Pyrinomonadaceae bacterium]